MVNSMRLSDEYLKKQRKMVSCHPAGAFTHSFTQSFQRGLFRCSACRAGGLRAATRADMPSRAAAAAWGRCFALGSLHGWKEGLSACRHAATRYPARSHGPYASRRCFAGAQPHRNEGMRRRKHTAHLDMSRRRKILYSVL